MSHRNAFPSKQPRSSDCLSTALTNRLSTYSKAADQVQSPLAVSDASGLRKKTDQDSKSSTDSTSSAVSQTTETSSAASNSSYGRFEDTGGRRRSSRLAPITFSQPTTSTSSNSKTDRKTSPSQRKPLKRGLLVEAALRSESGSPYNISDIEVIPNSSKPDEEAQTSKRRSKRIKSVSGKSSDVAAPITSSAVEVAASAAKVASKSVPSSSTNDSSSNSSPNSSSSNTTPKPSSSASAAKTAGLTLRKGSSTSTTTTASGIVDSIANRLRPRRREHQAEPLLLEADDKTADKEATGDNIVAGGSKSANAATNSKVKSVTTTTSRLKISGGSSSSTASGTAPSSAPVGLTSAARTSISSRLRNARFPGTAAADNKLDAKPTRSSTTSSNTTSSANKNTKVVPASASSQLPKPSSSSRSTTRLHKTDTSTSKKQQMSTDKHAGSGNTANNADTEAAKSTAKNASTTNGVASTAAAQSAASSPYQHLPMFAELSELAGGGVGVDEAEMTRLQTMLEQRGFPPHIFGSLGSRFQQLIGRVNSNNGSKVQNLLTALKSRDDSQAIAAISELNQILVMGNEDTLAGFPVKTTVTALQEILSSSNFDLMNNACRALNYLIEALPRSISVVALAIPQLIQKLLVIDCIDVAETALTTLEQLSRRHGKQIVQANGIQACLNYIDFFGVVPQRNALAIVANCCNTLTSADFQYIQPVVPMLSARVRTEDKRSVECVVSTLGKLVDTFKEKPEIIQELASYGLLDNIQHLLVVSPPLVGSTSFVTAIKILTQVCGACPDMAIHLLKSHIDDTLCFLLTGSADWAASLIQQQNAAESGTPTSAYKSAAAAILSKRRSNSFVRHESVGSFGGGALGKRARSGASFSGMGAFGGSPGGGGGGGGMSSNASNGALPDLLTSRNPQEIYELIMLIVELIPKLPEHGEELFEVNSLLRRRSSEGGDAKQQVWEWEDDDGAYHAYNADDAQLIEASFNAGAEEANITIDDRRYSIEFTPTMQQLNEESGTTRNVRRRELPKRTVIAESSSSSSKPTDDVGKDSTIVRNADADDIRAKDAEYMRLCQEFIVKVFPVVYAVYGSSAGVVIKQKCLQGMLKMVYYCCWAGSNISSSANRSSGTGKNKEVFEAGRRRLDKLLDRHDISSHIAALLASSELKLVIGGFQLASILMHALPEKYFSLFRREGVLYQMEQLAQEKTPMFANMPPPQSLNSPSLMQSSVGANVGRLQYLASEAAASASLLGTSVPTSSSSGGDAARMISNLLESTTSPSGNESSSSPTAAATGSGGSAAASALKRPTLRLPSFMSPNSSSSSKTYAASEAKTAATGSASSSSSRRKTSSSTKTSTGDSTSSSSATAAGHSSRVALLSDALATAAAARQRTAQSSVSSSIQPQQFIAEEESAFAGGVRFNGSASTNRDESAAPTTSATGVASAAALEQQYQQYRYQALASAAADSRFQTSSPSQSAAAASMGLSQSVPSSSGREAYALLRQLTADRYGLGAAAAGGSTAQRPPGAGRSVDAGMNEMRQWRLNREEARQWLRSHAQEFCAKYAANSTTSAVMQRRASVKAFSVDGDEDDDVAADAAGAEESSNPISTVAVETTLQSIFQTLQTSTGKHEGALRQLSGILLQGDASPFEIIQSGMVKSLLNFLTENNWPAAGNSADSVASQYMRHRHRRSSGNKALSPFATDAATTTTTNGLTRRSRLISFCHVFMDMPSEQQVRQGFMDSMDFIVDPDQVDGFQHLVQKLNSCLTHLEQLPVKVNDAGGSVLGYTRQSSIMRFLNHQQIKCQLQRHPSAGASVKAYRLGHQVRVDPLAPVQSIVQFLTDRGFADSSSSEDAANKPSAATSTATLSTSAAKNEAASGTETTTSSVKKEQRKAAQNERRRLRALRKESAAADRKLAREAAKSATGASAVPANNSTSMSITDDDSEIALIEPSVPPAPSRRQQAQRSLIDPASLLLRNVNAEVDDDDANMDIDAGTAAVELHVEESGDASMSEDYDDAAGTVETNEDDDDDDADDLEEDDDDDIEDDDDDDDDDEEDEDDEDDDDEEEELPDSLSVYGGSSAAAAAAAAAAADAAAAMAAGMPVDISGSIKTEPGLIALSSTSPHAAAAGQQFGFAQRASSSSAMMRPRLELLLNDHVLPYDMTIFQAVKQYGNFMHDMPESETETEAVNLAHVQIFANTHVLYYRPVKLNYQPAQQQKQQDDAVLIPVENAAKSSSSTGTSRAQPFLRTVSSRTSAALDKNSHSSSSPLSATKKSRHQLASSNNAANSDAAAAKSTAVSATELMPQYEPFKYDPEFSRVWTACEAKTPRSRLARILDSDLTALYQLGDPSCEVIALLRVLDALNDLWAELYHAQIKPMPRIPEAEFFYNSKIVTKVNRQLQEPVIVLTGQLPQWLVPIGRHAKFLLPFLTRLQLFYTTALDRDRALHRLLETNPDVSASLSAATRGAHQGGSSAGGGPGGGGGGGGSSSHYYMHGSHHSSSSDSAFVPRLEKRRKTVNRNRVLQDAKKLFKDSAPTFALLEIQFEDEVGTGLGPTLEFYSLVSHELRRRSLNMWHVSDNTQSRSNNAYVQTPYNLFPAPIGPHTSASAVKELQDNFRFLGQFMAKAVMDFRILDLPLNPVLFMHVFGLQEHLGMGDLALIDPDLEKSLDKFHQAAHKKLWLETESNINETEMRAAVNAINIDGCSVEDLWITFTLPGYPDFELCKGGKDKRVTLDNVGQYVDLVLYWFLRGGVRLQCDAFREGFNSILPINRLELFKPEELEFVFCGYSDYCDDADGTSTVWDVKSLIETCNPDHGFTHDSAAIKWLFEIMAGFTGQERREFLQFVTGCPKLPIGGFRALTPPLTVVRRTVSTGEKPDDYLPSVMTCVNYLKLPEYSSKDHMRERLRIACSEGRFHFHLS